MPGDPDYQVLDPHHAEQVHSSLGPPPVWMILPSLTARFFARHFRELRDWLYVVSIAFLVLALIGYLFKLKILLHLGALGVIAANIGMLVAGLAYLVSLPFKESLFHGLANLLIPFYAIYYWTTRWPKMKGPVHKTLGAFLPIALIGVAYLIYEEAPAVEKAIEKEMPIIERSIEDRLPGFEKRIDRALDPARATDAPVPGAETTPRPGSGRQRDRTPY